MLSNRSIPRATVIPVLAYPDVNRATTWLCDAFGFSVRLFCDRASWIRHCTSFTNPLRSRFPLEGALDISLAVRDANNTERIVVTRR